MRKLGTILRYTLFSLLLIVLAAIVAIQSPLVQTAITGKLVEKINGNSDAVFSIGSVHFKPFNTIVLKDVTILDRIKPDARIPDTLGYIGSLYARFSLNSLIVKGREGIVINELVIKDVHFNMTNEENIYHTNLKRIFRSPWKPEAKPLPDKEIFLIKHVVLMDSRYTRIDLTDSCKTKDKGTLDFGDLEVYDFSVKAENFRLSHGLFSAKVYESEFKEKSGLHVTSLTGEALVGKGDTRITNLRLKEGTTDITLDFEMLGKKPAFRNFVRAVVIHANLKKSFVSMETISHFTTQFAADSTVRITLDGGYAGSVSDLMMTNFKIGLENSILGVELDGYAIGLPAVDSTLLNYRIKDLTFSTAEIERAVKKIMPGQKLDISKYGKNKVYTINMSAEGTVRQASSEFSIMQGQNEGNFQAKLSVNNLLADKSKPRIMKGSISTDNLDIGALIGKEEIGALDMYAQLSASFPVGSKSLDASIDSLKINKIVYNGHCFENIFGNVHLEEKDLTADIQCKDKHLNAAIATWSDKYNYYTSLNIQFADLNALGLDKRFPSTACAKVYGRLDKDIKNLQGNVKIYDMLLTNSNNTVRVSDIAVSSENHEGIYDINLSSDFAQGTFSGNRNQMNLDLMLFKKDSPLPFINPDFYIEDSTFIHFQRDTTGLMSGKASSNMIAIQKDNFRGIRADFAGTRKQFDANVVVDHILFRQIELDRNMLKAVCTNDTIMVDLSSNVSETAQNATQIKAGISIADNKDISFKILPSWLLLGGKRWNIPASGGAKTSNGLEINDFKIIYNNDEWIGINGKFSNQEREKLSVNIHNLNLNSANEIFKEQKLAIAGKLNLDGELFSGGEEHEQGIQLAMKCDSVRINDINLGDISVNCDNLNSQNLIDLRMTDIIDGDKALSLDGKFASKDKDIDADINFDNFPLGTLNTAISAVDKLDGRLSGRIKVKGNLKNPDITCDRLRISDGYVSLIATNVPYSFGGDFVIKNDGIKIETFTIKDRLDHKGSISGALKWSQMKNPTADIHIDLKEIEVLNQPTKTPGTSLYGNLSASAVVDLKGPLNDLKVNANVRNVGQGSVHAIISGKATANKSNLLTFVNPTYIPDAYQQIVDEYNKRKKAEGKKLSVAAHADISSGMQIFADMGNNSLGTEVVLAGNGGIDVKMETNTGLYALLGDFVLTGGSFNVSAGTLISRKFTIKEGSSIVFGGDIMESTVNIDANYQTRANVATLIGDTTSVSGRRIVNCGINIKDKLSDPRIKFSIDIPDLDPSSKSRVESALSTEDKVQKQFLALLVSNSFLPDEQSGIVNNNNSVLYSNVADIMANQVNNVFTRLDIPLDLGLNYQPDGNNGKSSFDVALSTQLFDNRVIIGGSIGNRRNGSTNNETLVGDLDIQWKIIRSGALRLNVFSHSQDQYSNYLDNSQRNGVGIIWQQEFNRLPEWFKKLFSSKARREALEELERLDAKQTKKLVLYE